MLRLLVVEINYVIMLVRSRARIYIYIYIHRITDPLKICISLLIFSVQASCITIHVSKLTYRRIYKHMFHA